MSRRRAPSGSPSSSSTSFFSSSSASSSAAAVAAAAVRLYAAWCLAGSNCFFFFASAQWTACDNFNSIHGGSCNGPTLPCEPNSGCTNAGKTTDVFACESLCEAHPNCSALTWHDSHVPGGWAGVCVLQTQAAWSLESQKDHHAACLKTASFPQCSCGGRGPAPAPAPAPHAPGIDTCLVAQVAAAKADQALGGRGNAAVYASLDNWLQVRSCPNASAIPTPPPAKLEPVVATPGSKTYFVSPLGSDDAAGTSESAPFATLQKAQQVLRDLPVAERAGSVVNLLAGTHELGVSLVFTPADNGAPGAPVTWQAYPPGAPVAVSGGATIPCDWQPTSLPNQAKGVFKCTIPSHLPAAFDELFVDGLRQVRARFPNGDPLIPHSGYTPGAQAKAAGSFPNTAVPACGSKGNVQVVSQSTGKHVSTGCVPGMPADWSASVSVVDIDGPRGVTTTAIAYANSSRFNDTFNLPMWATTSTSQILVPQSWSQRGWTAQDVETGPAVVKMMHPQAWGSWVFAVDSFDSSSGSLKFGSGGNQEARGSNSVGDMYIENILAELDDASEWFVDSASRELYFLPKAAPNGQAARLDNRTVVEVPFLPRVIQFRGSSANPVEYISMVGFNVSRAAPTYLDSYEAPSGGDWAIHRGGAVFIDGAQYLQLERLYFDQVGGNGVFLSNFAKNNSVKNCDFWRTGDSCIAAVGSTRGMNGTAAEFPSGNTIAHNHFDTLGIYTKQTSCYFKSQTFANNISNNICHDGPRAGVNFNDGFMGGDVLEENVIWGMVRESGDHGTFNSWDRKEYFFACPASREAPNGSTCFMPQTHEVRGNMFIGPAGWNMDHDDGSSEYHDYNNIVYQGGYKYRDGIERNMTGNLMVAGAVPIFQVFGFSTDYFVGNYLWGQTKPLCGPNDIGGLSNNIFIPLTDGNSDIGKSLAKNSVVGGSVVSEMEGSPPAGREVQGSDLFSFVSGDKCDLGTVQKMTLQDIELLAHGLVGL